MRTSDKKDSVNSARILTTGTPNPPEMVPNSLSFAALVPRPAGRTRSTRP